MKNWENELNEMLPLLGHRNWIVLTDMAYPLQAKDGIVTIYADAEYAYVLNFVIKAIKDCPHIRPHVCQDMELNDLDDNSCPGIEDYKTMTAETLGGMDVKHVKHEELISRLDSVSNMFKVVIIKTRLLKPFTSVFFELDCKYWQ